MTLCASFFNIPVQRSGVRKIKAKVKVKVKQAISQGLAVWVFACVFEDEQG